MLGWINVHRGRDSAGLTLDWSRSHAVSPPPAPGGGGHHWSGAGDYE